VWAAGAKGATDAGAGEGTGGAGRRRLACGGAASMKFWRVSTRSTDLGLARKAEHEKGHTAIEGQGERRGELL
jgi:hypothetical protein